VEYEYVEPAPGGRIKAIVLVATGVAGAVLVSASWRVLRPHLDSLPLCDQL